MQTRRAICQASARSLRVISPPASWMAVGPRMKCVPHARRHSTLLDVARGVGVKRAPRSLTLACAPALHVRHRTLCKVSLLRCSPPRGPGTPASSASTRTSIAPPATRCRKRSARRSPAARASVAPPSSTSATTPRSSPGGSLSSRPSASSSSPRSTSARTRTGSGYGGSDSQLTDPSVAWTAFRTSRGLWDGMLKPANLRFGLRQQR